MEMLLEVLVTHSLVFHLILISSNKTSLEAETLWALDRMSVTTQRILSFNMIILTTQ